MENLGPLPSEDLSLYTFSFVVWPDETREWCSAVFLVFEAMKSRIEVVMKPGDFLSFRGDLGKAGLTLREIERVPYHVLMNIL